MFSFDEWQREKSERKAVCLRPHSCLAAQQGSKPKWGSLVHERNTCWHLLSWSSTGQIAELKQPDFRSTCPWGSKGRGMCKEHLRSWYPAGYNHSMPGTPPYARPTWCSQMLHPRPLTLNWTLHLIALDHLMKFHFSLSAPPRLFCPLERREGLGKGPGPKLRGQLDPSSLMPQLGKGRHHELGQMGKRWNHHQPYRLQTLPYLSRFQASLTFGTQSPRNKEHSTCLLNEWVIEQMNEFNMSLLIYFTWVQGSINTFKIYHLSF